MNYIVRETCQLLRILDYFQILFLSLSSPSLFTTTLSLSLLRFCSPPTLSLSPPPLGSVSLPPSFSPILSDREISLIKQNPKTPNSIRFNWDECSDDKRGQSKSGVGEIVQEMGQEASVHPVRTSDDLPHRVRRRRPRPSHPRQQRHRQVQRRPGMGDHRDPQSPFQNRTCKRLQPQEDFTRRRAQGFAGEGGH